MWAIVIVASFAQLWVSFCYPATRIPWLKLVNIIFLQWFGVRLTRCQQMIITDLEIYEVSITPYGATGLGGRVVGRGLQTWYSLQGWIAPFKGMRSGSSFPPKTWCVRISKRKTVCVK